VNTLTTNFFPLTTWTDRNNPNWEHDLFSNSIENVFQLKDFTLDNGSCWGCSATYKSVTMTTFTRGKIHNRHHAIGPGSEYRVLCDDCATDYLTWINYCELQGKINSRIEYAKVYNDFCQTFENSIRPLSKLLDRQYNEMSHNGSDSALLVQAYNQHMKMFLEINGDKILGKGNSRHKEFIDTYTLVEFNKPI